MDPSPDTKLPPLGSLNSDEKPGTETEDQRRERLRQADWHAESDRRKQERFEEVRVQLRMAFGGVALNGLITRGTNLPDALKQIAMPNNIVAIDNAIAVLFNTPVK